MRAPESQRLRPLAVWLLAAVAGALLLAWAFPRAYPFYPERWQVTREEAVPIALERLRDLGELPRDPYVVARMAADPVLDRRLALAGAGDPAALRDSWLGRQVFRWGVTVYPPGGHAEEWFARAEVGSDGFVSVLSLRRPREEAAGELAAGEARERAAAFLREQGFDLTRFGAPEVRTEERDARIDTTLRYPLREEALGEEVRYGVEVTFAGDRLTGFSSWLDDPARSAHEQELQLPTIFGSLNLLILFIALPFAGALFVRRYHAGEVGVGRALQIAAVSFAASLLLVVAASRPAAEGLSIGALSRQQVTLFGGAQLLFVFFIPLALTTAVSWAVGESSCRERWGGKLAAFDALWQRRWQNATVARAGLRGLAIGLLIAAATVLALVALRRHGVTAPAALQLEPWWNHARWPGLALLFYCLPFVLFWELFGRLFLLSVLTPRLGRVLTALLVTGLTALVFMPPVLVLPFAWALPFWLSWAGVLVFVFLRYDLLATLVASYTARVVLGAMPLLRSGHPGFELQGAIAVLTCALPLLLALRHLLSGEEYVYRWDDVPPHVRRIAERERQRVELETARNIQSSILPELPASLCGLELAYTYRPATEVGGDFYDALPLADGRLAVAVGDVAGHGVSSGLVMSMARAALAVQVAHDPRVEAVFATLNRLVHQSARKRLLATLCYAVVDPVRRTLELASAGHLSPYRVTGAGRVEALEAGAYPLGVRAEIEVRARWASLEPGDLLVLFSDGVIEARPGGSDDLYGFERLERSLARQAGRTAAAARDALLADLLAHTGDAPGEDDLTLLVLRLP